MNDMRQILEAVKADAPPVRVSVDEIVRSGRRRARRRTFARGAGVLCGVGAVVLAAVTVLPVGDSGESGPVGSAAVAPAPPFTFTFRGYAVGDFRVTDPLEVTPGYERTVIERSNVDVGDGPPTTLAAGTLTVYRPGVFRADRFRAGTPVSVGGREGFATALPREVIMGGPERESRLNPTKRTVYLPALAWQYADGAWATVESDHLGDKTMPAEVQRQLAERFTSGVRVPATVPFRVTHLPDGWKLGSAGARGLVAGDTSVALARYVPATTDFGSLTGPLDLDAGRAAAIRVTVAPVETEGPYAHPVTPPCPAGQHFCDVRIDGGRYYAEVHDQSGTLPAAQLKAIADGLEFAKVADKSTWFPLT